MENKKYILVIHGPNMNLIGLRKKGITLDKLNNYLRKLIREKHQMVKIFQMNDENKAVAILQRYRNQTKGVILFPGPWQQCGYVLKDTLELINLTFVTISSGEKVQLLKGRESIEEEDLYKSCKKAVTLLADMQ
ncbi:MAG: type II 3-dehydroquinate dehydratase [Candidatus Marinimicrobia bacterium]|jgi:3-dehydroquinate dehydratase-2|nr:type II 3-dehydroquinate dehydratase [Candidatus Neomarinimicrobiota bacterium]MDP6852940.1 type II 3-dehydroquinate dehydratase [Candidatus Neomarinimicrobiota bacterium]